MNVLALGLLSQRLRAAAVEHRLTDIGPVGEDGVDGADAKAPTTLGAIAAFIEPDRELLDAERTAVAVPSA